MATCKVTCCDGPVAHGHQLSHAHDFCDLALLVLNSRTPMVSKVFYSVICALYFTPVLHLAWICCCARAMQLPWHLSTHQGREQQTRLLSGSSAEAAAAAESASSSSSSAVKPVLLQTAMEHQQPPAQPSSAAAEAAAAGADGVQAATAEQPSQQQQQQQQPAALNFTDHHPQHLQEAAAAAAAAAAASAPTAGLGSPFTPQQVLQQQGAPSKQFVVPSALISLNPGDAVTQMLPLICSHILKPLAPFQLDQNPGLTGLNHQERLTMQHQRGFRVREDAFASLNMLLTRFVKSQELREAARAAHIPKAVRDTLHYTLEAALSARTAAALACFHIYPSLCFYHQLLLPP